MASNSRTNGKGTAGKGKTKPVKKKPGSSRAPASKNGNGSARQSSSGNGSPDGEMLPPPPPPSLAAGTLKSTAKPDPNAALKLLGVRTKNYIGALGQYTDHVTVSDAPLFYRYFIPAMLRDPEIWFGLQMIGGPIASKAKYKVESQDPEVAEFVQRQIDRFLIKGMPYALLSVVYGYIGLESLYEFNEEHGFMEWKDFKYIHPNDARPVLKHGGLVGMWIKKIRQQLPSQKRGAYWADLSTNVDWSDKSGAMFLGGMKIFWAVHDQKSHRWYGRSRLEGAFLPWYQCWQPQGYESICHAWFYRHCYDSGVIWYPPGSTPHPETGEPVPNIRIATEMLDRRETGAGVAFENKFGGKEAGGWGYDPPNSNAIPEGLLEWGDKLTDKKWMGMGVPPEVARSEQTGSFAGRRVPQQGFYSFEQEISNEIIFDWDEQNIRGLARLNYGRERAHYDIKPVPILVTLQQEEMGGITGHLPGDPEDDFYSSGQTGGGTVQSGGRIEDRDSNGFNQAERQFAQGARR